MVFCHPNSFLGKCSTDRQANRPTDRIRDEPTQRRDRLKCLNLQSIFSGIWSISFFVVGFPQYTVPVKCTVGLMVAMISEGYKLKTALASANIRSLCVFSCPRESHIPPKNSVYPRNSGGYEGGYGPRGRVSRRQHDSERRSNTKT